MNRSKWTGLLFFVVAFLAYGLYGNSGGLPLGIAIITIIALGALFVLNLEADDNDGSSS